MMDSLYVCFKNDSSLRNGKCLIFIGSNQKDVKLKRYSNVNTKVSKDDQSFSWMCAITERTYNNNGVHEK